MATTVNGTTITEASYNAKGLNAIYIDGERVWGILTYTLLDDGTYSVKATNTSIAGDIVIPSTYNGKAVTAIARYGFRNCDGIRKVIIPDSVIIIDEEAFYDCDGLISVVIPNSVATIGYNAFQYCDSLISITIPSSVTSFGSHTFDTCRNLTTVIINEGVTYIPDYAFYDCEKLKDVSIPDSVTRIGSASFGNCDSLTTIVIPKSVVNFSSMAFSFHGCSFSAIYYEGTEAEWSQIGGSKPVGTKYYYSETQPTTYGNYWHYVDGVPTVWEIPIYTYALDVNFRTTAYTHPGSGQTVVGDVGAFNAVIPTEISSVETLEIPVYATYTKQGYLKLSLYSYENANCTLVETDSTNGVYTLTISNATGDVSISISGTSP